MTLFDDSVWKWHQLGTVRITRLFLSSDCRGFILQTFRRQRAESTWDLHTNTTTARTSPLERAYGCTYGTVEAEGS